MSHRKSVTRRELLRYASRSVALTACYATAARAAEPAARLQRAERGEAISMRPPRALTAAQQSIARKIAEKHRHAIALVASQNLSQTVHGDVATSAAQRFIERQSPSRRARARNNARKLVSLPSAKQQAWFGAWTNQSLAAHQSTTKLTRRRVATTVGNVKIDPRLKPSLGKGLKSNGSGFKLPKLPRYQSLAFHLNNVTCLIETGDGSADDEILLGGFAIAPDGTRRSISSFLVSDNFDKNETVHYPPFNLYDMEGWKKKAPYGKRLVSLDLGSAGPWPRSYVLNLTMGEQDATGGFDQYIDDIWNEIEQEVTEAASDWITSALGGGFWGEVLGAIAVVVIDLLVELLKAIFDDEDDLVDNIARVVDLPSPYRHDYANLSGRDALVLDANTWAHEQEIWDFKGGESSDGGRYKVRLHWRVDG